MKYILSVSEIRQADELAIQEYGINSSLLMENAAHSSAEYVKKILGQNFTETPKVLFFCGSGNNGGDGFALARHLVDFAKIKVFWIGDEDKMSPETHLNFKSAMKIGIPIEKLKTEEDCRSIVLDSNCIIDALIGVGGSENVRGLALEILKKLKNYQGLKIAIDVPTGLNSEIGKANEYCFEADYTITMFAIKKGMLFNDGPDKCGKILVASLGAPEIILQKIANKFVLEENDFIKIFPRRKRISSKFDYGRVLIIAGSRRYPGAASLVANSCIKSGTGLVLLATTSFHPSLLPEVIQIPVSSTNDGSISLLALNELDEEIKRADVIAIGSGIGTNSETMKFVRKLVKNFAETKKMVIDADALKAFDQSFKFTPNVVITPHTGEFASLIKHNRKEIEENIFDFAVKYAKEFNCILHLKYVPSISTNGETSFINPYGNPGMATGGSGDVLTGIIASMLARGLTTIESAAVGSFIHSRTGDIYFASFGGETLTASELVNGLKEALRFNEQ